MLFNSFDFALFLPIVFITYWLIPSKKINLQNAFIVLASYFFYGCWDWRFLSLIIFSTVLDYTIGIYLNNEKSKKKRKALLWLSIIVNLGFLAVFKYYNFFIDNFVEVFSIFGIKLNITSLQIILPVGISFYTFQTLSYTIDVYKNKLNPTKNFFAFSAFVSFFPQLVAGPIERATNLLPQFHFKRTFNYNKAIDGLRQILWGLFKKIVIADNCAEYANYIFNNSEQFNGSTLFLGAIFFAFQIYGDFSGYSDIAIGTSRLFGFHLKQNFAFPYFSRDIAEFWRRWHMSLSTWFRDYLYIPLGGSKGSTVKKIRNVFIIFIVSGFWHGANWTFIAWGTINALYFLPLMLFNKNRRNTNIVAEGKLLPTFSEILSIVITFSITVLAWIFFRAENISHAFGILNKIFSSSFLSVPQKKPIELFYLIIFFLIIEWLGREKQYALENLQLKWNVISRWFFYLTIIVLIYFFNGQQQEFIYFQF
ncbi:MBOAT family O-acyltransferase [Pseudofulvibacter geojedonensis]|uniref:MBOAT family O-acyltransferase n=1 Tax=Pseudofulvibacter geojedonensis TaxID=1123758 RepID=A0ABW3I5E1_9FLAO